jgi:hypothetical protein
LTRYNPIVMGPKKTHKTRKNIVSL